MAVNIHDFDKQTECVYKNERYSVRNNGAVLRHARPDKKARKYDNCWTFGTSNKNGYMLIVTEVVHRIVATAFLGEPPTPQHIVDHLDTNRQNNRPENLRWLTKLENILNNPITVEKIVFRCGSIEAFLKNPSLLSDYENDDNNFSWMRAVNPDEARASWERLSNWANKQSNISTNTRATLGEWLYQDNKSYFPVKEEAEVMITSNTPDAVQKNWKTPCEFPHCPQVNEESPIVAYATNLKAGAIFSRNKYSSSVVSASAISKDGSTLWVMCKNSEGGVKPWTLAQVNFENSLFVHTNLGSFLQQQGVEKYFTIAQGLEWTGGESIDDFM